MIGGEKAPHNDIGKRYIFDSALFNDGLGCSLVGRTRFELVTNGLKARCGHTGQRPLIGERRSVMAHRMPTNRPSVGEIPRTVLRCCGQRMIP